MSVSDKRSIRWSMAQSVTRTDALLRAILALAVADREARLTQREPRRTEVVLADSGLAVTEIADLTGRNHEAVKRAIQRSRTNGGRTTSNTSEATDGEA